MKISYLGKLLTVSASTPKERYANESALFYALRNLLKSQGVDCVKRRPDRDGHLCSAPYYIRSREKDCRWLVFDSNYAIMNGAKTFNQCGQITLEVAGILPLPVALDTLTPFERAYCECALWSSNDNSTPQGGEPLDKNHSIEDIDAYTIRQMILDCQKFTSQYSAEIASGCARSRGADDCQCAGHDFWLTRCGHGAGFWDGDWPEPQAAILTAASKAFGNVDLYVGDDCKIHA